MNIQVYDSEQSKIIEISEDRKRLAAALHQQVAIGVFISALALKRIRDEKLFLALNCQSFNDYLLTMSPISKTQAYLYIKIAEKFQKFIQVEGVRPGEHLSGEIQELGPKKLYEIARLDDDDIEGILKNGSFSLPNGSQLSLEEIKDMTLREFKEEMRKFKESRDKYQSRIAQLDEENKTLAKEKEILQKQLIEKEQKLAELKELESKYGARAGKLAEKRKALELARNALAEMDQYLFQVNATVEDPESLQRDLVDFIRRIDFSIQNAQRLYGEIIANIS